MFKSIQLGKQLKWKCDLKQIEWNWKKFKIQGL
jgi:glutathione peroxidase-family protein